LKTEPIEVLESGAEQRFPELFRTTQSLNGLQHQKSFKSVAKQRF